MRPSRADSHPDGLPLPTCRSCGRAISRDRRWGYRYWRTRTICSTTDCTGRGEIAPDYPGAVRAETVSSRCPCGGPWRAVAPGVVCVLCGTSVAIVECLEFAAREGRATW